MELNHPGWQDSVENAASVAVDAAIRAMTYNGANALMLVCVCVCACVRVLCVWCVGVYAFVYLSVGA